MTEQRTRLTGWGAGEVETVWWKRGRDPIGRHTMVAVVFGVIMAALVGAVFDPLNLLTAEDIRRAEQAAYEIAFADAEPLGYVDGIPYGELQYLGAEIVAGDAAADSAYGDRFSDGWSAGWNEALTAMRQTALDVGLPENYTEFRVLDEFEPR